MTITYPLAMPSNKVASIHLTGQSVTVASTSPFDLSQQIQEFVGQSWMADISLPPLVADDAEPWIAFLLSLRGRRGTFLMGDPARINPRGVGTGTPLINGGSQTGSVLITDGWTHSITNIMKAGDYLQWVVSGNYRLHKILANQNSDSSGNATFDIWPDLRESPPDNTAITVVNTKGQFRLVNSLADWTENPGTSYTIAFGATEAI